MAIIVFSIISFYFENYNQVNLDQALISPFFNKNILGTDQFGRDVFLRASRATYISIMVGFSSNIIASILGVFIGAIAGFYKKFDMLIMGFIETIQSFPTLLILIAIISVFNPSIKLTIFVIGIVSWPPLARIVRGQVLQIKSKEYIVAAKALGYSNIRIMIYHVLMNCLSPMIIIFSIGISNAIMFEAGLSFLGLGVQPPDPSLGRMINEGKDYVMTAPFLFIFPSIILSLIVIAFNLIGEGFRELLELKK